MKCNIILVGAPGVGKSTLGKLAAAELGMVYLNAKFLTEQGMRSKDIWELFIRPTGYLQSQIAFIQSLPRDMKNTIVDVDGEALGFAEYIDLLKYFGAIVLIKRDPKLIKASGSMPPFAINDGSTDEIINSDGIFMDSANDQPINKLANWTMTNNSTIEKGVEELYSIVIREEHKWVMRKLEIMGDIELVKQARAREYEELVKQARAQENKD